jgi:AcrR family transcriptional regulator
MPSDSTRNKIIETADRFFYEQGFEATSFADIAQACGLSRGNFYYYFKTKDAILEAVIARRAAFTEDLLLRWQAAANTPAERIRHFIHMLIANQTQIMAYGCPVGTLCSELSKLSHPAQSGACGLFTLFRLWLRQQFEYLGRRDDANALAMHLLARSQGVATLAQSFHDEAFIRQEVALMDHWLIQQIPT